MNRREKKYPQGGANYGWPHGTCLNCGKEHGRLTKKGNSTYYCQECTDAYDLKEARRQYREKIKRLEKRKSLAASPKVEAGDKRTCGGYVVIWDGYKWLREHRIIFEQILGRKLLKEEVVHHRNGNKSDNRIENLQLLAHTNHCPHIETKHSEDICRLLCEINRLKNQAA